jgi:hypothetical protein
MRLGNREEQRKEEENPNTHGGEHT